MKKPVLERTQKARSLHGAAGVATWKLVLVVVCVVLLAAAGAVAYETVRSEKQTASVDYGFNG
jgi:hypothetical protein